MLAYTLTVLASLGWFLALSFSGTSLTLFLKGKSAIRLFYAYHIAVQCLLISTMVVGLLRQSID